LGFWLLVSTSVYLALEDVESCCCQGLDKVFPFPFKAEIPEKLRVVIGRLNTEIGLTFVFDTTQLIIARLFLCIPPACTKGIADPILLTLAFNTTTCEHFWIVDLVRKFSAHDQSPLRAQRAVWLLKVQVRPS